MVSLLAVGLLSGCGANSITSVSAVTVNGTSVSDSDFKAELEMLRNNPEFAAGVFNADVSADGGTVDSQFAASVLRIRILVEIVDQEVAARGLEVTDEARAQANDQFTPELQRLLERLPEDYSDRFLHWNAQLVVLRNALAAEADERGETTDADVERFFEEYPFLWEGQACASHILVETEDEADTVIADLEAGADFDALATERSIDPSAQSNAGDLGCAPEGQYVPPFEAAVWTGPVGEIQGPVETDFGFHVILVTSRGDVVLDDIEGEIRAFLDSPGSRDGQQLLSLYLLRLGVNADVKLNPRYGTWDGASQTVAPPEAPRAATSRNG